MEINAIILKLIDFINPKRIFNWIIRKIYPLSKILQNIHIRLSSSSPLSFHLKGKDAMMCIRFEYINGVPVLLVREKIFIRTLSYGRSVILTDHSFVDEARINEGVSSETFYRVYLNNRQVEVIKAMFGEDSRASVCIEGKAYFNTSFFGKIEKDFRLDYISVEVNI